MNDKNKSEKLLDALNDTKDDMIIAADPEKKAEKRRIPLWGKVGAAAAAVIAVGGISAAVMLTRDPGGMVQSGQGSESSQQTSASNNSGVGSQPVDSTSDNSTGESSVPEVTTPQPQGTLKPDEDLQKITAELTIGGMGFEGIEVPEISDYASGNPWNAEQNIIAMPVYYNRVACGMGGGIITDADYDTVTQELKSLLIETAGRLGVTLTESDITDYGSPKEEWDKIAKAYEEATRKPIPKGYFIPGRFEAVTDKYRIETSNDFCTDIHLSEPVEVPVDLNPTDYDKAVEAAEYLLEEYSDLLNMTEPKICIDGGDYKYNGERGSFEISFYDAAGSPEEDIVSYFMSKVTFYGDDNGDLFLIRIYRDDLAGEHIGNYPLITQEEAEEMLKNGEYATSAPIEEGWKPDSFDRAELVYRTGHSDPYFLPYYKFWIDITEELGREDSINPTFGAFYIPAVEPQYIEDVPTYDGSFNK